MTFTESSETATYDIYRSTSPISTLAGLTPIATLPSDSGTNRYTNRGHVICDLCPPLADNIGLLVWTPSDDGVAYYAAAEHGARTFASVGPVRETRAEVPGAVLLGITSNIAGAAHTQYRYFAWEDYATWRHDEWEYYGHRFDVYVPEPPTGYPQQRRALIFRPHAAGSAGYREPGWHVTNAIGVVLTSVDMNMTGFADPYNRASYFHSKWFGRVDSAKRVIRTITEDRHLRYLRLVRDDPRFAVDPARVYVVGASMGSASMHFASHHPELFAAAAASIGWINDDAWAGHPDNRRLRVNTADGPRWRDWQDMAYMAARGELVPIVHTFNKDDRTIDSSAYPGVLRIFEEHRQPYAAKWQNGNHLEFYLDGAWSYLRFRKDEAYPAFSNSSNSSDFDRQEGQRNALLDWSSSLHSLGDGTSVVDLPARFEMTLKSLSGEATADVTIRNAQRFKPSPGTVLDWRTITADGRLLESGTARADTRGLVTVRIRILDTNTRLILTCERCGYALVTR